LLVLPGCSPEPIPQDQLDFFRALSDAQYWTTTAVNIVISDANNKEMILLDKVQPGKEAYLSFQDFSVTKGTTERPVTAHVAVTMSDGSSPLVTTTIGATSANMATLQGALTKMESNEHRTQRLEAARLKEEAARRKEQTALLQQAVKDAKALQQKGRFRDAMARLESVRTSQVWSSQQETLYGQLIKSEVTRIVRLCRVENDEFRNLTFVYSSRDDGSKAFRFYPYLGKDSSSSWWFLSLTLYREDWLFAKQVMVKIGDTTYSTVVKESFSDDVKTDVLYGGVYECVTFRQSDAGSEALFQAIANYSGTAPLKVRVNGGQYYAEYSLNSSDVQAWRDLLFLYGHLNEYTFSN
jgi:hypothetical protein